MLLAWEGREVYAEPTPTKYKVSALDHLISDSTSTQFTSENELGYLNWSTRTLHTLGVGTHILLSPTGGWGQRALDQDAIDMARQRLGRLGVELYRRRIDVSRCDWELRSRLFQSPKPHTMTDGTVHLSASMRFEVYESCLDQESAQGSLRRDDLRAADGGLHALKRLEASRSKAERSLVFARFQGAALSSPCLEALPRFSSIDAQARPWRAVRWLWLHGPDGRVNPLYSALRPTLRLGELKCVIDSSEGPVLMDLNGQSPPSLSEVLSPEDERELWIWVSRS